MVNLSTAKKREVIRKDCLEEQFPNAKPFLKWAGGKTQLLNELSDRLPQKIIKSGVIYKYIEPFVGGGALFFYLKRKFRIKESLLLDINRELIIGYKVIQNNHRNLIKLLAQYQNMYLKMSEDERKKFYYSTRKLYNKQISEFDYENYNEKWVKRAAQLIFLNKTCFNGLFRQNSKGEFNVPYGKYKNPKICDEQNIIEVNKALVDTKIICGDFLSAELYIDKNSFVYLDPPYRPINSTSSFTCYSKEGFSDSDQKRLADFYKRNCRKGSYLMLSNSDPKNYDENDDFFDVLYTGFNIERVSAKRSINSDGKNRGEINELIIRNYWE